MKPNFFLSLILILTIAAASSFAVTPTQASTSAKPYIIVFKDTVDAPATVPALARAYGLQAGFVYQHALKGMSATVPDGRLAALKNDARVAYVVEDFEPRLFPPASSVFSPDATANIDIDGTDDYRVDVDVAVIDTGSGFPAPRPECGQAA
jgi:subtilisin